jgi:ribosomal protein S18 acetylase RimI-like enzyme
VATIEVVRTHLEMRSTDELRSSPVVDARVTLVLEEPCSLPLYRRLYREVGEKHFWRDRLVWSDAELARHLERDEVAVWVLRVEGEEAGYFELVRHPDLSVEIAYFGLRPAFIGRGLGGHLLTRAVEEAWRAGADRVWLHTCTLDGPAALPNYRARGFREFKRETYWTEIPD